MAFLLCPRGSIVVQSCSTSLEESLKKCMLLSGPRRGYPISISSVQHEYKWRINGLAEGMCPCGTFSVSLHVDITVLDQDQENVTVLWKSDGRDGKCSHTSGSGIKDPATCFHVIQLCQTRQWRFISCEHLNVQMSNSRNTRWLF